MSIRKNGITGAAGLLAAILVSAGCSAIPTAEEYQLKQAGIDPNDVEAVQAYLADSGLGTVNAAGEQSTRCERRRSTGSNIGMSSCRRADRGSQPIRQSTYREQPPQIPPGLLNRGNPN